MSKTDDYLLMSKMAKIAFEEKQNIEYIQRRTVEDIIASREDSGGVNNITAMNFSKRQIIIKEIIHQNPMITAKQIRHLGCSRTLQLDGADERTNTVGVG